MGVLELLICRFDGFLRDTSCAENVKEILLRQCGWRWLRLRAFLGRDLTRAGKRASRASLLLAGPKGAIRSELIVEEDARVADERFGVLEIRAVAGVRVQDDRGAAGLVPATTRS